METIIDLIKSKIKRVILKKCLIFLANITIDPKDIAINVEKTKNITFGDFSVNTALTIGFKDKEKIMKFATAIAKHLSKMKYFEKATAVFPGFINITISQ
jgi:arginyl-tRNA synthetase